MINQDKRNKIFDVIVIGGGPAGMMAAGRAAQQGRSVLLLEKNAVLGTKLLISGKGRCNITNTGQISEFIEHYIETGRFLYNSFQRFFNQDLIDFLSNYKVKTKVERGGRIFPASDRAKDVRDALSSYMKENNVKVRFLCRVGKILLSNGKAAGVKLNTGEIIFSQRVILATGGLSYPKTGSTGDGFFLANELGHSVVTPWPGLVGLEVYEPWIKCLAGSSLKNVEAALVIDGKKIKTEFGEMLFTHFGVSGPIILKLSMYLDNKEQRSNIFLTIDLKPALTAEQLKNRLSREIQQFPLRHYKNFLKLFLPSKLIAVFIMLSKIPAEKKVNQLTKHERLGLISLLKELKLKIRRARSFTEAIVTRGGVSTKEINPKTMESKMIPGLYFCGEVIDIAGLSGGYNLQAAFTTGFVAGEANALSLKSQ